jgi:hypothetical protein
LNLIRKDKRKRKKKKEKKVTAFLSHGIKQISSINDYGTGDNWIGRTKIYMGRANLQTVGGHKN